MNLGENIYRLRTEKNMSQGDLAEALNVSRQSVSKWENNSAVPELEKLIKMSELFAVTLDALVGNEASKPSQPQEAAPSQASAQIPAQKIVGAVLLICAFLFFLIPFCLGDAGSGTLMCLCLVSCGIICIKARKHPDFYCMIALYLLLWIPMGILSPNYIRITFARALQTIHMVCGVMLLIWGFRLGEKEILFTRHHCAYIFFSVIAFTILFTFFMLLFPGLLPTPGLLSH